MAKPLTPDEKVEEYTKIVDGDDCWTWVGATDRDGYPIMHTWPKRSALRVQRYVYERDVEPIEPGKVVTATCRRRSCVNPAHMAQMTWSEVRKRTIAENPNISENHPRGEGHAHATITAADVVSIREAYARGAKPEAIGPAFFLSEAHIRNIVYRHAWSHIQPSDRELQLLKGSPKRLPVMRAIVARTKVVQVA